MDSWGGRLPSRREEPVGRLDDHVNNNPDAFQLPPHREIAGSFRDRDERAASSMISLAIASIASHFLSGFG
jgi:hypothetical protein